MGGPTLDCVIRLLVDTNKSATFGFGFNHIRLQHFTLNHMKVLQSNVVQPSTKCHTLM